ncbi:MULTISPECIES: NAD(P)H nitroreductase [Pseudoalteromonas]|uniref:Putative NAD(P)H nitroreductase n=1 Tax=Pseudoalteromonas fuliginea TaxID=1872678 RepID=A0AB73BDY5_9GAMM|nr:MULTISPECIES: NAD(P)H nitroreductase [Pseudoalteromonas]ATG77491.1 nitroreductase [Pseudoalteromonas sp. 1_2015MBL_MicDiv]KAA1158068.1 NAD(P)H nitroreductase [Pseudoalteromonas fuliginea]KDC51319.1 nitroreductase [Pseudoalteromonas fuliginea]KJZ28663.1 nitroreductase [Pseudoalteromonas fuliginea]MDQ2043642.1 NAD(P)H nitroreductase [Pseudoalteromonas sp. 20-92]
MNAIELLLTRQSDPKLTDPAPNEEQLAIIQQAALRVPDHGCIAPWQFIIAQGDARHKLGEIYHQSAVTELQEEKVINRAKELPLRAPMIIIAIAKYQEHPKVPRIEQIQSAGCSVLAMQQAAFAQGLGGVWRTGYFAQSQAVKKALNLQEHDEIVGYLYIGTPTVDCKKSARHKPENYFSYL